VAITTAIAGKKRFGAKFHLTYLNPIHQILQNMLRRVVFSRHSPMLSMIRPPIASSFGTSVRQLFKKETEFDSKDGYFERSVASYYCSTFSHI
jgi:hypothetical protein